MPDVFISYAREDERFVARLREALTAHDRDVWMDRSEEVGEGIEPGDKWRASIEEGIDRSDLFVFVLSEHSLASEPCRAELAHASSVNKRLLPIVVAEPTDASDVPAAIGEINWVLMRPVDDFDRGVAAVIRALDTDIEVVRQHTRLLVRARAWELSERRASPLLRGEELRSAEDWLARAADAGATPTSTQRDFILASRRAATRRQRIALAGASTVAAVAVALSVFALIQRSHAIHDSDVAYAAKLNADAQLNESSDPELSVLLADRSLQVLPEQSTATLQTALSESHIRARYGLVADNAPGDVLFDPSGRRVLLTSPDPHGRGWARIYEPGASARPLSLPGPTVRRVSVWDARGDRVLIGGSDASVYDALTGRLIAHVPGAMVRAALSADGREVVYAGPHGTARVYDLARHRIVATFRPRYRAEVTCLALTPDGRDVAQCDRAHWPDPYSAGALDLWSTASGRLIRSIRTPAPISSVAFSPDGAQFAFTYAWAVSPSAPTPTQEKALGAPGTFVFPTGRRGRPIITFTGGASQVAFGPDPRFPILAWATTADDLGHVYEFATRRQVALTGARDEINQIAVDGSGQWVLTASDDGETRVYDSDQGGQPVETLVGDTGAVDAAGFGEDGEYVVTSSADGTARLWQGPEPIPAITRADPPTGDGAAQTIDFADGGRRIVLSGGAGADAGQIIDARTLRTLARLRAPSGELLAGSQTTSDDATIASLADSDAGGSERAVAVDTFNATTGDPLARITAADGRTLLGDTLDPTRPEVAMVESGGVVELRDADTGARLHLLPSNDAGSVQDAQFSADGAELAVAHLPIAGGGHTIVQLWNVATGRLVRTIDGPSMQPQIPHTQLDAPLVVALSPNGGGLALAGAGPFVDRYDALTGRRLHRCSLPDGAFAGSLAFNRDGTMLAAGTAAGAVVWKLRGDEQLWALTQTDAIAGSILGYSPPVEVSFNGGSRYLVTSVDASSQGGGSLDEWDLGDGLQLFAAPEITTAGETLDGTRTVTAGPQGIDIYRCAECAGARPLKALARRRVTVGFSALERQRYLGR
jgi:WD40 repeat protein